MSARRSRSRGGPGAAGERGGGGRSGERDPAPPAPGPAPLRRSLRKSGPEAPAQVSTPRVQRTLTLKKIVPRTSEAAPLITRKLVVTMKKLTMGTTEAPTFPDSKSTAKSASPSSEIPLVEKENSPPVRENPPIDKSSPPLTAGPSLEVTTTVLDCLTPNAVTRPDLMDARDLEMSRKVRRSYSRLDDLGLGSGSGSGSTSTPNYCRRSFFGFERLLGEDLENVSPVVGKEAKRQAITPTAESWRPDSTLPGITMTKEKRRKRKVPEILKSELDEWAAAMNAQFEDAEKFDLLVE